jgi:hypothetical protein
MQLGSAVEGPPARGPGLARRLHFGRAGLPVAFAACTGPIDPSDMSYGNSVAVEVSLQARFLHLIGKSLYKIESE